MSEYLRAYRAFLMPALLLLALTSCIPDKVEEPIPAYLYIPGFSVQTGIQQGSSSSRIKDVWLTVGGNFLGTYELPALIPILESGQQEVRLDAGIRDNGINTTPEIYPFYEPVVLQANLKPGIVDTMRPMTGYSDKTRFALIEPFERDDHLMRDIRTGDVTSIKLNRVVPFEGKGSLEITLTEDKPLVELASLSRMTELGLNSPYVYLELNYKSEVPVIFGLVAYANIGSTQGSVLLDPGFYPEEDWQKIYFNLSSLVYSSDHAAWQLVLRTVLEAEPEATVLLDNLKLVFF